jgi:putative ABC transport system permease protein
MWSEFRFAARALGRWRGGLAVAVLTLAVGIGTTTSLSAVVRVMLADFPGVPELDRVARVYVASQTLGVERSQVALNEFDAGLSHATSFAAIGAYAQVGVSVGSGAAEHQVTAGYASPAFFRVMGVAPAAGRVFSDADLDRPQPVVVLSDALWRKQFPDGGLTNASVSINGIDRAVVGVMPATFSYQFVGVDADVWIPLGRASHETPPIVQVFARLRPGIGWPAAAGELAALKIKTGPWSFRAIPIAQDARYRAASACGFTLGPAIIVLLIACVNVACMLLARGIAREKELSIRRALGATRARVVRQLLTEHALLALAGGTLGCGLAAVLLRTLAASFALVKPELGARLAVDATLLPIALAASVAAALVFGVLPALRMARRDVAASLNGVPATHRVDIAGYGARDLVVFVEVGSAVGLIVFAAMLFNLFSAFQRVKPAFPAAQIVTMRVPGADLEAVAARVAAIPGVARVTVSSGMLGGRGGAAGVRVHADGGRDVAMSRVPVGAAFFETLQLPLVRGRSFDAGELRGRASVVVLTESAARALSPSGEVIGMRVRLEGHVSGSAVVIGVCRDAIAYGTLARSGLIPPTLFVPYEPSFAQEPVVLARVSTDAHGTLRAFAAAAGTPAGQRRPEPGVLGDEAAFGDGGSGMLVVRLLGGFALIALLLAGTGVFSVISQSVAQRTRELGIRMAIGATPRGVLGLVLARETKLIGAALVSGALFTAGLTQALFTELATLSATAPTVWMALVGLGGGVAAIAVALATWRIVRLDPSVVLRRS